MNGRREDADSEMLLGTCGNSTSSVSGLDGLCKALTGLGQTPRTNTSVRWSNLGSPKSGQDPETTLERGIATHHGVGYAEVEGSLRLDRLQQVAEGTLGEAEPRRAAGGQQQGGGERRSLRGGHHAALHVPTEELQGTEQGKDVGGAQRTVVAPGTLSTHGPHGEAHMGLINFDKLYNFNKLNKLTYLINIQLLQTVLAQTVLFFFKTSSRLLSSKTHGQYFWPDYGPD